MSVPQVVSNRLLSGLASGFRCCLCAVYEKSNASGMHRIHSKTISAFRHACEKAGFLPEQILPHDSYLINHYPEAEALEKSRNALSLTNAAL